MYEPLPELPKLIRALEYLVKMSPETDVNKTILRVLKQKKEEAEKAMNPELPTTLYPPNW